MIKSITAFSGLSVEDLAKAKVFYSDVLGLDLVREEMGLEYKLPGGGRLFIYEKSDHTPATFTVLNFVVEDIDHAVDSLADDGVIMESFDNLPVELDDKRILRGIKANMGPDIAWFKDPAGNIIGVLQEK